MCVRDRDVLHGWSVMEGATGNLAEAGMFPTVRGEVVEKAEGKIGARFSRDEIEVDFMKGAHALSEGAVSSWVIFSFICVRGFLR